MQGFVVPDSDRINTAGLRVERLPEKPPAPNLPTGYRMTPGGGAELIPGVPPPKGDRGSLPEGWEYGPDGKARPIPGLPRAAIKGGGVEGDNPKAGVALSQVDDIEALYKKSLKGRPAGRLWGMTEYLPTPSMQTFDQAAKQMLPLIRPLIAQTAREGDSNKEMEVFMSYIPSTWDNDESIQYKIGSLRRLIGGMQLGMPPSRLVDDKGNVVDPTKAIGRDRRQAAAPARIKDDTDYEKLPSGAQFIGPDGKLRRKP